MLLKQRQVLGTSARGRVCSHSKRTIPSCAAASNRRESTYVSDTDIADAATWRYMLSEVASKPAPSASAFTAALAPLLAFAPDAAAKGGEYGLFEGRTMSLIHPALMFFLLGASLYNAYSGFQWRRVRTLGTEISNLKKQIPATPEGQEQPPEAKELQAKIDELSATRKKLADAGFRDKHWNWGALILALGVGIAIEGPVNTYMRLGKLVPGPHLYSAGFIVPLWALGTAMIPYMQRGNNAARYAHIGINLGMIALFIYQVPSGLKITKKVLENAPLP